MKDYSKYIKSEYIFITNIETNIENKSIKVTTSKNKKGKPHTYELNKNNIQKLYNRLEKQYEILIENKDEISAKIDTDIRTSLGFLQPVGLFSMLSSSLLFAISPLLAITAISVGVSLILSIEVISSKKQQDFNSMIETYEYYLENRHEIESSIRYDENILSQIDDKTETKIKDNQALVAKNLIDEVFDIQLMDKISLKQLKEIISQYKISASLAEEQCFSTEEQIKTTSKSRIKNKK